MLNTAPTPAWSRFPEPWLARLGVHTRSPRAKARLILKLVGASDGFRNQETLRRKGSNKDFSFGILRTLT